jgi:hypothetical protein
MKKPKSDDNFSGIVR